MTGKKLKFSSVYSLIGVAAVLLSGCATTPQQNDPLERYNRAMYSFNEAVDKAALKPIAKGYNAVMPELINTSIRNFFSNLDDISVVLNDILQFKFRQASQDSSRFLINTTMGIGGLFDVASIVGYQKHHEDFGQTLGKWGVASGPYIVLPLLGPSNLRDTLGLPVDIATDPIMYLEDDSRYPLLATRIIDKRASLLSIEKVVDQASIDKYTFIRDAWQQRRQYLVYDGNPPDDDDFDVFDD